MAEVKILGKTRIYPAGTQYLEIASDYQKEFEDDFPYEETDDQLRCIEEIKRDMERF